MDLQGLTDLMIKSIEATAKSASRLESIELALNNIRDDIKSINVSIGNMDRKIALLEENQRRNEQEHHRLHERCDEIEDELKSVRKDHNPCKAFEKTVAEHTETHKDLKRRITDITDSCKGCPEKGYEDMKKQIDQIEKDVAELCKTHSIINYEIKGFPLWLLFVFMALVGFITAINNHWEWLSKAWEVVK